ncbi:MAG: hypothetical protein GXO39_08775 [Thermotogae bacterium]|nr:hypothetical protein [Thermotogota bacterium]
MIRLIGIPFETEANFLRGSSLAPAHIRWHTWGVDDYSPLQNAHRPPCEDLGDLWENFDLPSKTRLENLKEKLVALLRRSSHVPTLFLGGDHTITYATAKALREVSGEFTILHLDAHLDRWNDYGGKFSHATVIRRLEEEGFKVGTFGYRTVGVQEYEPDHGERFSIDAALEFVSFQRKVFVSLDLDVLDPSEFPCVSNPEPMGVSFKALLKLLISLKGKLVGAEMVEYLPTLDHSRRCGSVAAVLLREIMIVLANSHA